MPEVGKAKPDETKVDYYQKWGSRAQWVSALATVSGVVVAVCAIWVAWSYYRAAVDEQKNKLSADALLEWSRQQPPNTRACLDLLGKLKTEELAKIIAREEFSLSSRGADAPSLVKEVLACFSDLDDISKFFNNGNLTPRGVSLLASRANASLDSDSFIASLSLDKVGNPDMFKRVRDVICRDDVRIIDNLPKDERTLDSFVSLRRLIETPYPSGCKGRPPTAKS
jgi:hypothetical protein